jgi:TRAP transporter TAXI family solute receptor
VSSAPAPAASGSSAAAAPAASPAPSKVETKYYNFGASPATAAMYPLWVGVGKAVQEAYPEYQITVSESRGAVDVSNRVRVGDVVLGNSVARSDYENYHGLGKDFEGDPNPNARIAWYYGMTYYTFCVSKESGINSFPELEGKRISSGGTGTTLVTITEGIMNDLGIKPDYYDASKTDAGDAYGNRQIVGMCSASAIPDSFVLQLHANLPINILSFTQEEIDKVVAGKPYYVTYTIPANTYEGVDHDVLTLAYMQGSQSTADLPQEDCYKFVKAVFDERFDVWAPSWPQSATLDYPQMMLNSPIPCTRVPFSGLLKKVYRPSGTDSAGICSRKVNGQRKRSISFMQQPGSTQNPFTARLFY